jgi:hypothetical protein
MIAEPTLERYVYYLRWVEGDRNKAIQEHRAAFEKELRALLAHLERLSGQSIPAWEWPQESQDRHVSQRIVNSDWLHNLASARSYLVEARTYGDVYRLQIAYCQRGQAGPEVFASLRDEAWQPSPTEHLLGSSSYLCGIAAKGRKKLAAQAIETYRGHPAGALISTHLGGDRARLYGSSPQPYVAALLYPDEERETWAGRTFLNNVGPRLELYRHKAARQLAWCEENLPLLFEQERSLRDLLGEAAAALPADLELLRRLVQFYRVFSSNVGMLVERQATIGINLYNLDMVLKDKELEPLAEDRLLASICDDLRRRQKQLEADLIFADRTRQRADETVNALRTELELEHLLDLRQDSSHLALIERAGWPGTPPPVESEITLLEPFAEPSPPVIFGIFRWIARLFQALMRRFKPSQPLAYPQITPSPLISLAAWEKNLLRHAYQDFDQVLVEKEFGGGYGGARVYLALPVAGQGVAATRKVTKLGPAHELRGERDNYEQYVEDFLPFCTARVERERYYERGNLAALNYVFVGGGTLGQAVDLEEYYRRHTAEQVARTLDDLLDKDLGQSWFGAANPLRCFFAAEYGQHMVEHLRLRLRPASSDVLWPAGQAPAPTNGYRQVGVEVILHEHETLQAGALLSVEGMVVQRIKHGLVKLQDPGSQGTIVRVEFAPGSDAVQELTLGRVVGVRGEVVYNRRARMEQIVRAAFPDLSPEIGSERIELPGVPGGYPNPLRLYPEVLGRTLQGQQSYVHGDLHLRNILVDEWGKGWLIDFARVEKRHNLFDFVKLETYVRLMALAGGEHGFSLGDYVRFEESLAAATLGENGVACPDNADLFFAHQVIQAIRDVAGRYMAPGAGFVSEYFPALFLYCLAVMKYHRDDVPRPTRLAFATALVLGRYL